MEKPRLYAAAALSLMLYGLIGYVAYTGFRAHSEGVKLVRDAEQYRAAHHGALAECACDFGFDEQHAFYERTTLERYVVDYYGPLGNSYYDSAVGHWQTRYWWNKRRENVDGGR